MKPLRMFGLLVTSTIACGACKPAEGEKPAPASPASSFAIDVVTVVEKPLDVTMSLPGELTPFEQVEIFSRANGFVATVTVDRGSTVKKGDVLARLAAPELAAQRLEAEAKFTGEKTTLDHLQAAAKQNPGAVAGHEIEVADATLRGSAARAGSLRALESYLLVKAPFDGVVTERNIHPGALVGPNGGTRSAPMFKMESIHVLRLTVAVPEDQTSAIRVGDSLDFTVSAWPDRKFAAKVVRVAHALDARTRTMPIELDVDNADGVLSTGMYATVLWHARRPTPSLFVPESAVGQSTEKMFVVRVKEGKSDPVTVRRGRVMSGLVEVFGDIQAGDAVAKRGSEELKAGTPVTVRAAASASASAAKP